MCVKFRALGHDLDDFLELEIDQCVSNFEPWDMIYAPIFQCEFARVDDFLELKNDVVCAEFRAL